MKKVRANKNRKLRSLRKKGAIWKWLMPYGKYIKLKNNN